MLRAPAVVAAVLSCAVEVGYGTNRPADAPSVQLRVFRHATLTVDELARVQPVVEKLLAPAELELGWVDCDKSVERCFASGHDDATVEVLALPVSSKKGSQVCGETARSHTRAPGVIVYVPCAEALAYSLRRTATDPRLLSIRTADIVGLTIAHELGHVWGLPHVPRGLMVARFDRTAVLAFQSHGMGLTPEETSLLRASVRAQRALLARR